MRPLQPIPADLVAVAVVAAARAFGDDPMAAVECRVGVARRSASAAALGLHHALGEPITRTARLLGLQPSTVETVRRAMRDEVAHAAEAAEREVLRIVGPRRLAKMPCAPLSLGDRILVELCEHPRSGAMLATMLGEKEIHVSMQLSALANAGEVVAGLSGDVGARHRLWRLAQ